MSIGLQGECVADTSKNCSSMWASTVDWNSAMQDQWAHDQVTPAASSAGRERAASRIRKCASHARQSSRAAWADPRAKLFVHAAQRGLCAALLKADLGRDIRALQLTSSMLKSNSRSRAWPSRLKTLRMRTDENTFQKGEAADTSTTQLHLRQGVGLLEGGPGSCR